MKGKGRRWGARERSIRHGRTVEGTGVRGPLRLEAEIREAADPGIPMCGSHEGPQRPHPGQTWHRTTAKGHMAAVRLGKMALVAVCHRGLQPGWQTEDPSTHLHDIQG